ncbi:hypothetical protein VB713_23210 [Anabaena cylindrica UHCC 0172]|nr:hypothetical protein [Anabaena cylindrica]MEA5553852.1 hypothetical protein [Anabaena cylindrica UHCC 0172]
MAVSATQRALAIAHPFLSLSVSDRYPNTTYSIYHPMNYHKII